MANTNTDDNSTNPQLQIQKPKVSGFIDKGYNKNRKRIEDEEAELEALMKSGGAPQEDLEDEVVEEGSEAPKPKVAKATDPDEAKEEESFKKRYGSLRRHMSEKEKEWKEKFESLETQLQNPDLLNPPKSDEDIEAWVNKHPDVAAIVKTLAAREAQTKFSSAEAKLKELDEARQEASKAKAEQEIRKVHPDFDELKDGDAFHDWAEEQPKWVRDAIYENSDDPRSVVRVIDLFKVDMGITDKDKARDTKRAASAVKTSSKTAIDSEEGGKVIKESQVQKMTDKEYAEKEGSILEAMRTGKFVYDISGSAR